MMRSLYSGISGLRNHQTRMDVIGNNIANVNTAGYKTSRVIFQDIFSQTLTGGAASNPAINIGGVNPMQIGLGIKLAAVDVLHTRSAFARTDSEFDMMVGGDGYFIVEGPEGYYYTRAGNFKTDNEGYLVTTDGYFVMGYSANPEFIERLNEDVDPPESFIPPQFTVGVDAQVGTTLERIQLRVTNPDYDGVDDPDDVDYAGPEFIELIGFSVDQNGSVEVIINNRKVQIATIALAMFSNPAGLDKAGNSLYRSTPSSGDAQVGLPRTNGAGSVEAGGLEMSNVDLATEFTDMIVTQRGFQANSRVITVSDTMLEELVNLKR